MTLVPAGISWLILPHNFLKFLSAAALIQTTKCSSCKILHTVNVIQRPSVYHTPPPVPRANAKHTHQSVDCRRSWQAFQDIIAALHTPFLRERRHLQGPVEGPPSPQGGDGVEVGRGRIAKLVVNVRLPGYVLVIKRSPAQLHLHI